MVIFHIFVQHSFNKHVKFFFLVIKVENVFAQIQCGVLISFLDIPQYLNIFRITSHHSFPTTHN